jgi:hypothetical protein
MKACSDGLGKLTNEKYFSQHFAEQLKRGRFLHRGKTENTK